MAASQSGAGEERTAWQTPKPAPTPKETLHLEKSPRRHNNIPKSLRILPLFKDDKPVSPKSSAHETDNPQISLQSSGCSSLCFRFCQFTIHKEENFKPKLFCHESDCIGKIAVAIHRKIFFPGRK